MLMHAYSARETVARMFLQAAPLLAVAALLLSSVGPLIDHHFTERHPGHVHIYGGPESPEHVHPYQADHLHLLGQQFRASGDSGIVFLAPNDGVNQGYIDLAAPAALGSVNFPRFNGDTFLFSFSPAGTALREATVAPLWHPPRI